MTLPVTLVFIDLAGSMAAYAAVGNAQVADTISKITQWIGRVCEAHGGRTVKFLGDGVLAQFARAGDAIEATVFMQQSHTERLKKWPSPLRMGLKIGIAHGPVVAKDNDVYGDPVNLAARLSEMAGPNTIWADESVVGQLRQDRAAGRPDICASGIRTGMDSARFRALGMIGVRGTSQTHSVFQIEWNEDVSTDLMTVRGALQDLQPDAESISIALAWLGKSSVFDTADLPVVIGRIPDSDFVVSDQRVSRSHARIEMANGALVVTDLSSFGTSVRFAENPQSEVQLRRNQCVLHSMGELALGASFSDFSAAVVAFHVSTPATPAVNATRPLFGEDGRA